MTTISEAMMDVDSRMKKCVEAFARELVTIRTGRASPALVEGLMVDYYGIPTPLGQIATITVPEGRMLLIQPWDKQALKDVERGVLASEMGLVPSNDGTVIRISIPPLTAERRRDLVKLVGRKVEEAHVAVRNVRRDGLEALRTLEREKTVSQDDNRRGQEQLQRCTDAYIAQTDQLRKSKEDEVREV